MHDIAIEKLRDILNKYHMKLKDETLPHFSCVERLKEELILCALDISAHNKAQASKLLGIKRTTLTEMERRIRGYSDSSAQGAKLR